MKEDCISDLSVIHQNRDENFQTLEKEKEGMCEMLDYLALFEDDYISIEDVQQKIVEEIQSASKKAPFESLLTIKLKQIKEFVERSESSQATWQFLLKKYKNLVRCVFFHQTSLVEDYSLLFDILLAACKKHKNHNDFLMKLQSATSVLKSQEMYDLTHGYLQITYILLWIKLSSKQAKLVAIQKLKECCMKDILKILPQFALRMILRTNIGVVQLKFFRDMIGYAKYDRLVMAEQSSNQVNKSKEIAIMEIQQTLHSPLQTITIKDSSKDKGQNVLHISKDEFITTLQQNRMTPHLISPFELMEQYIEVLQSSKQTNLCAESVIKAISLKDIKQMPQSKHLILQLLQISFIHLDMMNYAIQMALSLMQTQQFITQISKLFKVNKQSKKIVQIQKIVKKQLKKYCRKDSIYYWTKIKAQSSK